MLKHWTALLVALAYTAIALADGGYSIELIAAGTIAIWWVVIVGILARWWRAERPIAREAIVAGAFLAALGAWTALSLLWADDAGRAFAEVVRVGGYVGLFALAVLAAGTAGARPLLAGLTTGLAAVAVLALASRFFPGLLGGEDQAIFAALPSAAGRLSYPIGYWNGLAACMAGLIVLLAWFGLAAGDVWRRALAVGLIPLPVLVIYLASSRGGFAAALAGLLVLALLASASRRVRLPVLRFRPRTVALLAVVTVAGAAVLANPIERVEEFARTPPEATGGEDVTMVGDVTRGSGSGRYQYWETALDAFGSDPIVGIGAGNFELWWNVAGSLPRRIVDAHSLYLETLAELGIVGGLLLAGLLATLVLAAVRGARGGLSSEAVAGAALAGAGLLSAALDWTWELPAAFVLVIVGAAVLTGAPTAPVRLLPDGAEGRGAGRRDAPAPDRFGLGVAAIAVGWASIWVAGVLLITEVKLDDSRAAAARGDLDAAVQDAVDAGAVQPWSPEPLLQEAQVELLRGDVEAARAAVSEAIERAGDDWRPWVVAARIELEAGDEPRYERAIAQATDLAPLPLPAERVGAP